MGVHHLQIGFSQIGLYEIAMQYNPFIHNYEYDIYKSKAGYITKLSRELLKGEKDTLKLVRNPYKRAVSSFVSLIAPPGIENPEWEPIRKFIYNDSTCKKKISFKHFYITFTRMGQMLTILIHTIHNNIFKEKKSL